MTNFKEFLRLNDEKIRKVTTQNTVLNSNSAVVITKSDLWRKEIEWDTMYQELKR